MCDGQVVKRLVFCGSTRAQHVQQLVEANVERRQGSVSGASHGRKLQLFIDDINLPAPDSGATQTVCSRTVRFLHARTPKSAVLLSGQLELTTVEALFKRNSTKRR